MLVLGPLLPVTTTTKSSPRNRIIGLFPALSGAGGIQEAGRLTAAALAEIAAAHGWSTSFLSLNDPPGKHTLTIGNAAVPFSGFGRAKTRFTLEAMTCARAGSRIALAAHPNLALPAAQMKLVQPKLNVVVISHGVEVWQRLPRLRRRAFLNSDKFMAPSRYTIDQMVRVQGAPQTETRLIPWPLNPTLLELAQQPKLPAPAAFPPGFIILTVARLVRAERYKGVDQLILAVGELLRSIPTLRLVVVGGGDDLERHRQLASHSGCNSRVHFFDALSSADTAACYARSDVFALPSTGEGFGLVFLEAMAFGKPVVGAAAGGITDIIEHEKNGLLVPPNDLGKLTQTLQRLATDESLRRELGRKGAETVRSQYQFGRFRTQLESLLWECGLEPGQLR